MAKNAPAGRFGHWEETGRAINLAVIAGASFADAARLSNYAAGLVVMKLGTATVSPDELIRAIQEKDVDNPASRR